MNLPILIADDDDAIVDVVTIILESEGHRVLVAKNADEVYAILKEQQPLFVLLDISLGGSDGKEVARKLRQEKDTEHLPIIISSAHANLETVVSEVGADGFLAKPFEIDELTVLVKRFAPQ